MDGPEILAVVADIHGNYSALQAVLEHSRHAYGRDLRFLQLGDLVSYGPRPNEVIGTVRRLVGEDRVMVDLAGNHEAALYGLTAKQFSTGRGLNALRVAGETIDADNERFLRERLSYEPVGLDVGGRNVLCVHGSLTDPFWGVLSAEEAGSTAYRTYDVVFCAHTHVPLFHEQLFVASTSSKRGRTKTAFVNPGSVGQPRNHDSRAQYVAWETHSDTFHFHKVDYDVAEEQRHFSPDVDSFYRRRLKDGV